MLEGLLCCVGGSDISEGLPLSRGGSEADISHAFVRVGKRQCAVRFHTAQNEQGQQHLFTFNHVVCS